MFDNLQVEARIGERIEPRQFNDLQKQINILMLYMQSKGILDEKEFNDFCNGFEVYERLRRAK